MPQPSTEGSSPPKKKGLMIPRERVSLISDRQVPEFSEGHAGAPNDIAYGKPNSAAIGTVLPIADERKPSLAGRSGPDETASTRALAFRPTKAKYKRLPPLDAMVGVAATWLELAVKLRFNALGHSMVSAIRGARDRRKIINSALFDAEFYQNQFASPLADPIGHYLSNGTRERQWPHPLFDTNWYLSRNPDVQAAGMPPLLHYLKTWKSEGRRPNEFFDPRWYAQNNPELELSGLDPITHYVTIGTDRHSDPAPEFDVRFYREQLGEMADSVTDPLAHFLHRGRKLGLRTRYAKKLLGRPVFEAEIHCAKLLELGEETALFVTHSPDGRIKPHVRHYLKALAKEGVTVILIVAADMTFIDDIGELSALVGGLFIRENTGYDFAAWAHVMRLHHKISRCRILYLLNDSVLGPTNPEAFHCLMERIRKSGSDIVGLTANRERGWHIQSYFLALKSGCLSSLYFHQFINDVVILENKDRVIDQYEIAFAPNMQSHGLTIETLFQSPDDSNPTLFHWRDLLAQGFPFLKVMTIRDDLAGIDKTGWREALAGHGFDVSIADELVSVIRDNDANSVKNLDSERWALISRAELNVPFIPSRVTFVGPWNFDNGLGVAARGYVTALLQTEFQKNLLPIHRPFHIHKRIAPALDMTDFVGPADVAILHLNPDSWGSLLTDEQLVSIERAQARIGLFVWESRVLPKYFTEKFAAFDRIWAPSQFCVDAFRAQTSVPVDLVPHVVAIPSVRPSFAEQAAMRRRLKLLDGDRVILYMFDATSYLVRKNPVSLVRAFAASGLGGKGWRLVLKTKHLSKSNKEHAHLQGLSQSNSNVTLLDQSFTSVEVDVLMEISEIYASSHCSEGFGLTVAEAMARSKIVVATDYGGGRDFLTSDCGYPVDCTEWETEADYGAYLRGTIWGRVNEDDLAAKLIHAASLDSSARDRLGEAARQRIFDLLSPEAVARSIKGSVSSAIAQTSTSR